MMRKVLGIVFAVLAFWVLVPALLLTALVYTHTGTDWLFSALAKRDLISYQELSGSIGNGLEVGTLGMTAGVNQVSISELAVTVELNRLAYGELRVASLTASDVSITLSADQDPPPQQQPLDLAFLKSGQPLIPIEVLLERLSIQRLTLNMPEGAYTLREIELAGQVGRRGVGPISLSLAYEQNRLSANGHAYLSPQLQTQLDLDWTSILPDGESIEGRAQLRGDAQQLSIEHTTASAITSVASIAIADWLEQPQLDITAELEALNWPLTGEPWVQVSGVEFQLQGGLESLQGAVNGRVNLIDRLDAQFALQATFARDSLEVETLRLTSATSGDAELGGQLDWRDGFPRWQGRAALNGFAANAFHELLPERVSGELGVAGSFDQQLSLQVESDAIAGQLRGVAFEAGVKADVDDQRISVARLDATVGDNSLRLSGVAGPDQFDVQFDLRAVAIDQVVPEASGSFTLGGSLGGSPQSPTLKADATGKDLAVAGVSAAGIELHVELVEGDFVSDANRLAMTDISYQTLQLESLSVVAQGPWLKPQLGIEAAAPQAQVAVDGEVGFSQQGSSGQLNALTLQGENFGQWQLEAPVAYDVQNDSWSLQQLCLAGTEQDRVCVAGAGNGATLDASLAVTRLPMSLLNAFGIMPVQTDGRLDIDANLQRGPGVDQGHARITQSSPDTPLVITVDEESNSRLSIGALEAEVSLQQERITGHIDATLNDSGALSGRVEIGNWSGDDSPLTASLDYEIPDLQPYTVLIPEVDALAGSLRGSIGLSNTLQQPRLSAQARLDIPRIYINPLAMEWTDLTAEITTLSGFEQQIKASLKAGEGFIEVAGTLSLVSASEWSSVLHISGDRALLMDQPNQRVVASPDLNITASNELVDVRGQLAIPEARLLIKPAPGRLALTPDAIVHEAGAAPQGAAAPAINLDLDVQLGDEVRLEAFGLRTGVTGNLALTQAPTGSLLGQGELRLVDGAYRAYGQDLTIDKGIIQFAGSLSQPLVDMSATRTVKEVKAGLKVSGPVDNLQTRLFSDPELSDSDILSYILRGKPLSDTTAADQNAVSNAALSYAISQSSPVTSKLTELSGLDEVSIGADEGVESLGFTLGKYITPELYIRYGVGVVDKLNKLFMQYQLSEKLFLETETGEGQSVDLIYRAR